MFGMCVEAQQADGSSLVFRDVNYEDGSTTFNYTKYNQFCIDQVGEANDAFDTAGITGIHTWPISFGLSNLNRAGYALSSGDVGNGSGFTAADINTYFAGRLTIDHYASDAHRDGNAYGTDYLYDINQIKAWLDSGAANQKIMIGEWGYHTTTWGSEGEQYGAYDKVVDILRSKNYIIGLNFWNHLGQTQSSLWTDTSGTINPGGRVAVRSLAKAFNSGNASNGWRVRV